MYSAAAVGEIAPHQVESRLRWLKGIRASEDERLIISLGVPMQIAMGPGIYIVNTKVVVVK